MSSNSTVPASNLIVNFLTVDVDRSEAGVAIRTCLRILGAPPSGPSHLYKRGLILRPQRERCYDQDGH